MSSSDIPGYNKQTVGGDDFYYMKGHMMSEKEFVWKAKLDKSSGKTFFSNQSTGAKKWALPEPEKKEKKEKKDKKEKKEKKDKGEKGDVEESPSGEASTVAPDDDAESRRWYEGVICPESPTSKNTSKSPEEERREAPQVEHPPQPCTLVPPPPHVNTHPLPVAGRMERELSDATAVPSPMVVVPRREEQSEAVRPVAFIEVSLPPPPAVTPTAAPSPPRRGEREGAVVRREPEAVIWPVAVIDVPPPPAVAPTPTAVAPSPPPPGLFAARLTELHSEMRDLLTSVGTDLSARHSPTAPASAALLGDEAYEKLMQQWEVEERDRHQRHIRRIERERVFGELIASPPVKVPGPIFEVPPPNEHLVGQLRATSEMTSTLRSQLDTLMTERTAHQRTIHQLQQSLARVQEEMTVMRNDFRRTVTENHSLMEVITTTKSKLSVATKELGEAAVARDDLSNKHKFATQEVTHLRSALQSALTIRTLAEVDGEEGPMVEPVPVEARAGPQSVVQDIKARLAKLHPTLVTATPTPIARVVTQPQEVQTSVIPEVLRATIGIATDFVPMRNAAAETEWTPTSPGKEEVKADNAKMARMLIDLRGELTRWRTVVEESPTTQVRNPPPRTPELPRDLVTTPQGSASRTTSVAPHQYSPVPGRPLRMGHPASHHPVRTDNLASSAMAATNFISSPFR